MNTTTTLIIFINKEIKVKSWEGIDPVTSSQLYDLLARRFCSPCIGILTMSAIGAPLSLPFNKTPA